MVTQCCVCKKILVGDDWVDPPETIDYETSHGYCPPCLEKASQQITDHHAAVQKIRQEAEQKRNAVQQ